MLRLIAAVVIFSLMLAVGEAVAQPANVSPAAPTATNERSMSQAEERLARADLHAQQTMATWTRFAALSGLALGLISVVVVYRQLRQNTQGLKLAADAARIEFVNNRAWVKLDAEGARFARHSENMATLTMPFKFHNVGRTPALDLTILVDVGSDIISRGDTQRWLDQLINQTPREDGAGQTIFPGEALPHELSYQLSPQKIGDGAFSVLVGALYRSAGDNELRITSSLIRVSLRPPDANGDIATLLWVDHKVSLPAT